MLLTNAPPIRLRERKATSAADLGLHQQDITEIYSKAGAYIDCFISPRKGPGWQLAPKGYLGHLPISKKLHFIIEPKVPIKNLFKMIEVASGFEVKAFDSAFFVEELDEVFERLAQQLARMVMQACRAGLYRTYLPFREELKYVRGNLDSVQLALKPHKARFDCRFEEHTVDVEENRILAWALRQISTMPFKDETIALALRALGILRSEVSLTKLAAGCCLDRDYNRLNKKYEPLHHLCWFFLANSGPVFSAGEHMMSSFLLNIDKLFESFVAQWLQKRLAAEGMALEPQYRFNVQHLEFRIDILIKDKEGRTIAVLDTKYKDEEKPSQEDVSQVATYALANGCKDAILVYPSPVTMPLDHLVGDIRVRSLWFDLEKDLDEAGEQLVANIKPRSVPFDALADSRRMRPSKR
jgi:5-methylcytosine-specific restriction enzyme subunit McrC